MDFLNETRFIERLQFFNGQRLFASDLQGIEAFNREMRWLHNKSLHQPGIGNGFAVAGKKDDREVQIGPGYAIDALGREIVLTQTQVEPVPPVAGEEDGTAALFDLTVSYPDDSTKRGACLLLGQAEPESSTRRRHDQTRDPFRDSTHTRAGRGVELSIEQGHLNRSADERATSKATIHLLWKGYARLAAVGVDSF
jgi:hypothetical protein